MSFTNVRAYLISVFVIIAATVIGAFIGGDSTVSFNVASNNSGGSTIGSEPSEESSERKGELPSGYTYQESNDGKYRWVGPSGIPTLFESDTYEDMVKRAWSDKEFSDETNKRTWK